MWAVVGLGNPGREYSLTRHNAGFAFIKCLAKKWSVRLRKRSHLSKVVKMEKAGERILLAMPQTYMNRSGEAVQQIVQNCEIQLEQLVIIFDDFDIPLGEIRIRKEGSAGSHKGMSSIIQELGSLDFPRIRIGIGPLPEEADAVEYVLSPFSKDEKALLDASLAKAYDALAFILSGEIDRAMNQFN